MKGSSNGHFTLTVIKVGRINKAKSVLDNVRTSIKYFQNGRPDIVDMVIPMLIELK